MKLNYAIFCASWLAVFAQIDAMTCKPQTPFKNQLVGKVFAKLDDCYRPFASTSVAVYKKMFILTIDEGIPLTCAETFLFVYRDPSVTPMIVHYPRLDFPLVGSASGSDVDKWCAKQQPKSKKEMFPVTETRKQFIAAVKRILPILKEIRDFGCETSEEGFIQQVPGRAYDNADVEAIMAYLQSVAYQYGFCV